MNKKLNELLLNLIKLERKDIVNIYLYGILSGLVYLSIPLGIQAIISYAFGATMVTSIYLLIAFVVLGTWLTGYFQIKVMMIIEKIQQKIFVDYTFKIAKRLPDIDLYSVNNYHLPELINRFFDTQNLQKSFSKMLLSIPTSIIQIIFGVILLSLYHVWFLVFGIFLIIGIVVLFKLTMKQGIETSLKESDSKYHLAAWLEDLSSAIKIFKVSSNSNIHLEETDKRVLPYLDYRTQHFHVLKFQYKLVIFFKVIITLVMLSIGVYLLINQKLNIGAFMAVEIVILLLLSAVEKLIKSLESYYDTITALAKLDKITELKTENSGKHNIYHNSNAGVDISFNRVNYSFDGKTNKLENISFDVTANGITVISGDTASGKSLLLNLIAGFYTPTQGNIFINGVGIENIDMNIYRSKLGLMIDERGIFKGTIFENISVGNENIKLDDVVALAKEIGIDSHYFSNDLLSVINDVNYQLPYSTKKIIMLLRALIGDKKLVLLKEPLEGLGENIKPKLIEYIKKTAQHRTYIIISQDKDLIKASQHHLSMNKGKLEVIK
ncbi:peptidase domain-containing ABC transporter [Riemerella anatipestifer]|uniref:peptidase domain-containing ABC transporter n=1 Tax=Riemerella anatipestifer TaxID=34085 RepID=UPI002A885AB8|nr:ABC transporter ATP-binding protein [Riemerella anatipestifer]